MQLYTERIGHIRICDTYEVKRNRHGISIQQTQDKNLAPAVVRPKTRYEPIR